MEKFVNKTETDNTQGYSYYSNLLAKPFSSLEQLRSAENMFRVEEAKKEAAATAKKNACNIVNTAIDVYEEGKAKCNAAIAEAYNEYKTKVNNAEKELAVQEKDASEKLNKWLAQHPGQGFHYTYKSKDGTVTREYAYYDKRYEVFDNYNTYLQLLQDLWK